MMKPKLFISAIEASADLYGAKLLEQIPNLRDKFELVGFGSTHLKNIGMDLIDDLSVQSSIGFLESLFKGSYFLKKLKKAKDYLKNNPPQALLVIDGQGFHMPLITFAKQTLKIPVIYFISPQEWQWGKEKRGKKVVQNTDLILDIYPEATPYYKKLGGNSHFIGHPLLDIVKSSQTKAEFFQKNGLDPQKPLISVFPGSRKQETSRLLPLFLKCLDPFKENYQFAVSCSNPKLKEHIKVQIAKYKMQIKIIENQNYDLMEHSELSLSASGTITLEFTCLEKPFIAAYQFNPLSFGLIKIVLRDKVPKFISWPNLKADKMIHPEFLQDQATSQNIIQAMKNLLGNKEVYEVCQKELSEVKKGLGEQGALVKGGKLIEDFLD